jgi:hypothetical protein
MESLEPLRLALVAAHVLGLAAIIGGWLVQSRRTDRYVLAPVLIGAVAQLVTGIALVGVRRVSDLPIGGAKIGVKLVIAVIVLAAAVGAVVQQRRGKRAGPALNAAGGAAVINVLVAVLWQ